MHIRSITFLAAGTLAVAACGGNEREAQQASNQAQATSEPSAPATAGEVHSANGNITEISGDSVTISHGPVESIGWPAMTMSFRAESPDMLQGLNVGDPVDFQFRQAGDQYVLTSIKKAQQ